MKHMRHWLLMIAVLFSIVAEAHDFEVDGIYYNITSSTDLTIEVTFKGATYNSYSEYSGEVVIPETVVYNQKTYYITSIGKSAFEGCSALSSIVIPESVISIKNSAFCGCDIESIVIPKKVTIIEDYVFTCCSNLSSVTLPDGITSIGNHAFSSCYNLESIIIPNTVTHIGEHAFSNCSLNTINMPDALVSIGKNAFFLSKALKSVHISSIESWCKVDLLDTPFWCLAVPYLNGEPITELVIPNTITEIKKSTFEGWSNITSVVIPESVVSIGSSAFTNCKGLTSVNLPETVSFIGDFVFYRCTSLTTINIPEKVTTIGESTFDGCTNLTSINIPEKVTTIGKSAFDGCEKLNSVHISNIDAWCNIDFESYDSNPLYYAKNLNLNGGLVTKVVIPDNVKSVKKYIFYRYDKLNSVDIPNGVTRIEDCAFELCTNLTSVSIPNGVTSIGHFAFSNCSSLNSLIIPESVISLGEYSLAIGEGSAEIYCYTIRPPEISGDGPFMDYVDLYVPMSSIESYMNDYYWSNFNIYPIPINPNLTVNFPVDGIGNMYTNIYIEFTNSNGELMSKYLIGKNSSYTFYNVDKNQTYNIYVKNKVGVVLGSIENIVLGDEDMTVTFDSLFPLQNIAVNVFTSDGADVTAESVVTWYDANGSYLCKDAALSGQVEETEVVYSVKLPKELAMQYLQPELTTYKVKNSDNNIKVVLESFASTEITGVIRDSVSNIPIGNAMVTFSQLLNGEYSHITCVETDNKGYFAATLYDVPTEVTVAADDYISYTISLDALTETTALDEILMKPISGVVVSTEFTFRTSVTKGEVPDKLDWYSDYDNVKYGILNKTTGLPVSNMSVQYPQLVLLDGVSVGDELLLTVVSRTGSFEPTQTVAIVDSTLTCNATFDIVELGGIKASYTSTTNDAVVGILYNEIGEMLQKRSYASGSLTFDNLRDGVYTLVSMGSSDYFNAIYSLSQLAAVGLVEGADYVKHAVAVESGVVSVVEIESVPTFNESKLYYTDGDTRFTVNKTSATAGNYLTLTGKIDFKEEYASKVSNVSMVIDIPESAVFVDNSVMVGAAIAPYTLEGNRLTISLPNNYTERVRFCIIPTEGGSYAPNAFAQFTIDGKEVLQPIGSAHYTIKDLSIDVPSTVAKTTIPVSGVAIANSTVQVYDDDVLIGETISLANGSWSTTCELHKPYNLSTHRIYAKVISKLGVEVISEMKECMYDVNAIQVSKVTMINVAHPANSSKPCEYVTVFDFLHPVKSIPDYWYWPDYPEFTFLIEFTDNDTSKVSNVLLWVETTEGNQVPLRAIYDENKELWVASGKFGGWSNYDLPTNVSLDFDTEVHPVLSRDIISNTGFESGKIDAESTELISRVNRICEQISQYKEIKDYSTVELLNMELDSLLGIEYEDGDSFEDINIEELLTLSEEFDTYIDSLLSVTEGLIMREATLHDIYGNTDLSEEYGIDGTLIVESVEIVDGEKLKLLGYTELYVDDNSCIYILNTDTLSEYIDCNQGLRISLMNKKSSDNIAYALTYSRATLQDYLNEIRKNADLLKFTIDSFSEACGNLTNKLNEVIGHYNAGINNNRDFCLKYYLLYQKETDPALKLKYETSWKKYNGKGIILKNQLAAAQGSLNAVAKLASKSLSLYSLYDRAWSFYDDVQFYMALLNSVPDCYCIPEKAESLYNRILGVAVARAAQHAVNIYSDFVAINAAWASIAAAPATGGTSLTVTAGTVLLSILKMGANVALDAFSSNMKRKFWNEINALAMNLECYMCSGGDGGGNSGNKPPFIGNGGEHQSNNPHVESVHDPSGYVYEGVSSNRLEGVMASCYYKETVEDIYGDQHENIVLWDAEEYAQENPLFTDANGMYRWDVPKGLWQVKFEKEGYETTYSEWLPVPPPQLEVNIPMVQNKQPEVAGVHAYKDGVEIEFDKYMQPATLNTDNIFVTQNGEKVAGTVALLNEEVAYEGKSETYASKVRFVFDQAVTAKEITLTVVNSVKSYAGLQMQDTYTQTFDIEQEVEGIVADSLVSMFYGGEQMLTIKVIPVAAAVGKTLVATSSSPMTLGVDTDSIVLDQSGEAVLTVSGELPGMGVLSYSLVGYDYRASTLVEVVYNNTKMTANPTASIASGSTVAKGTEVTLCCSTEGAAIYYTLDGSCPCDDTAILYDGTPIVINENTELRIMAVAEGMYESDVVVYNYYVEGADVEDVALPLGIDPTIVKDGFRVQGIEKECTVAVFGVGGELVMLREHVKNNTFINIVHVPEGMYIVVVSKDDDTYKQRILKVK